VKPPDRRIGYHEAARANPMRIEQRRELVCDAFADQDDRPGTAGGDVDANRICSLCTHALVG